MSQWTEQARRESVERRKPTTKEQSSYALEGAALAREVRTVVDVEARKLKARSKTLKLTKHEREALAQIVCERISSKRQGPTRALVTGRKRETPAGCYRARDILRSIDHRAEYAQPLARRDREVALVMGTGRTHIERMVRTFLVERRDWRDTAETFRTQRQLQEDTGPTVAPLVTDDDGEPVGALARRANVNPESIPTGADLRELAQLLTEQEGPGALWTPGEMVAAETALLAACLPDPRDEQRGKQKVGKRGPGPRLAVIAAEQGTSVAAVEKRVSRGGKLWRELHPTLDLLALVREGAAELDTVRETLALQRLVSGQPGPVSAEQRRKAESVERVRETGYGDRASSGHRETGTLWRETTAHGRPVDVLRYIERAERMPGGELYRATRRNLRATRPVLGPARPDIGLPVSAETVPTAARPYSAYRPAWLYGTGPQWTAEQRTEYVPRARAKRAPCPWREDAHSYPVPHRASSPGTLLTDEQGRGLAYWSGVVH